MVDRLRELGLHAELQRFEGERANAIGRWTGTAAAKVSCSTAISTPIRRPKARTIDPWGGLVDDNFIYGIGRLQHEGGRRGLLLRREDPDGRWRAIEGRRHPLVRGPASCRAGSAHSRQSGRD